MFNINKKYFEIWADEQAQNLLLKELLTFLAFIIISLTIALVILSNQNPFLVSISKSLQAVDTDEISWNLTRDEYIDSLVEDEELITFDDNNYYCKYEIQEFIEEYELEVA